MTTVAVLGTGIMGAGMARSLLREGLGTRVWNRTAERAAPLAADGAVVAATAADAVRGAGVVVTILTDGPATREAMAAAAPGLAAGQIWLQAGTVGLAELPALAGIARERGLVLVDAPVLGTRQPAEQGRLTVLAAGPGQAREPLAPVLSAVGARTLWLGEEPGAGQRLKLVLNSWVLALVTGVAEALSLAEGLGVDPALFGQVLAGGGLDSPYLQAKSKAILQGDFAPDFGLATAAKDAGLIAAAAREAGLDLDVAPAVAARFARAAAAGHGEEDMAATYFASFP